MPDRERKSSGRGAAESTDQIATTSPAPPPPPPPRAKQPPGANRPPRGKRPSGKERSHEEQPARDEQPPRSEQPSSDKEPAHESRDKEPALEEAPPRPKVRRRWVAPPAWIVSLLVHAVGLLVLGMLTIAALDEPFESAIVAAPATEVEELETVEFEMEEIEFETTVAMETAMPEPGAVDFGDVALESRLVATDVGVGPLREATTIGEIGALFGTEGKGMAEAGLGEGVAYFFGVKTKGNRFVYVVDNSNSMNGGKFETAVAELRKSVGALSERQYFYVIFFSDTAYPLFYPQPAQAMVPATEENKRKLEYWLMTVERCLKTKGREAMQLAFAMRPDAIYVLGDGAFTDNTVDLLMATPPTSVVIHTLGFRMKGKAETDFRNIAARFQGKFTEVAVTPAMAALSRRLQRPLNNTRHGFWGIQLPPAR